MRSLATIRQSLPLLALVTLVLNSGCATTRGTDSGAGLARAVEGDTVWVIENRVSADRRDELEQFLEEFWGAALGERGREVLTPTELRTFQATRVLRPVQPNPDGTYSYFFLMDPMVPGANYEIETLVERLYPSGEAERVWRFYEDSVPGPQVFHVTTQSRF